MSLSEASRIVAGELIGADLQFDGVAIDSRQAGPGDLFVAIRGERQDGHRFIGDALQQGAVAALVNTANSSVEERSPALLKVHDTTAALGQLAEAWRQRFRIPVIAITGSNGKTTVTVLTAAILGQAGACLSPQGSFNNHWGLPLTLLRLRDSHRSAVVELGMNHPGEIRYLVGLVQPTIALINNAAPAHLEGLGDIQGVAEAKGEIFEGLEANGTAIINADDPFADYWRRLAGERRILTFGMEQPADLRARKIEIGDSSRFRLQMPDGEIGIELPLAGRHNVMNALAAATAAHAAGAPALQIREGLALARAVRGRLQYRPGIGGALLIDDSYNANPASMQAALAVLAARPGLRIAVLGEMAELGEESPQRHRALGVAARKLGIDRLLFLDQSGGLNGNEVLAGFGGGEVFDDPAELAATVRPLLNAATTILIKGSRTARTERVADILAAPEAATLC